MTYHKDMYEGVGAISAERPAPRSAPAPMFAPLGAPSIISTIAHMPRMPGAPSSITNRKPSKISLPPPTSTSAPTSTSSGLQIGSGIGTPTLPRVRAASAELLGPELDELAPFDNPEPSPIMLEKGAAPAAKSSMLPIIMVGGAAAALLLILRGRKGRRRS